MARPTLFRSSAIAGALLLLQCGGQSTDLFDDATGGALASGGRGGTNATGGGATGGSATGGNATGGNATGGSPATGGASSTSGSGTTGGSSGAVAAGSGPTGGASGGSVALAGSGGTGVAGGSDGGIGGVGAISGSGAAAGTDAGSGGGGASAGSGGSEGGRGGKGAGGRGNVDCDALASEAASALLEARACDLAHSRPSCMGQVVDRCGCRLVVDLNESVPARRYEMLIEQLNQDCPAECTEIACPSPLSGLCKTEGTASMGMCEPLLGDPL